MWPILFRSNFLTVYTFGVLLVVAFLVGLFVIWKEARTRGLPEEKVLDVAFLAIIIAILGGRLGYVAVNFSLFSPDLARILLFLKYPGLAFWPAVLSGGLSTLFLARGASLSSLEMADIFSLAFSWAVLFGFVGCYLDFCVGNEALLSFWLIAAGFLSACFLVYVNSVIKVKASLSRFLRRFGMLFLCYLIFQSVSFLMLSELSARRFDVVELAIFIVALVIFSVRYREIYNLWFNSLKTFWSRLRNISNKGAVT